MGAFGSEAWHGEEIETSQTWHERQRVYASVFNTQIPVAALQDATSGGQARQGIGH